MFIVDHVPPKRKKLQYYRGSSSTTTTPKKYQISPVTQLCQRKPGKPRVLSLEDEILMTLMRFRLDAPVEDLAFRFGMSSAHASNIITTFILFLRLELEPTVEETLSYTHPHFAGSFHKCEGIGDCTEQYIEHSKNTDAQYQTYSTYKSHNTLKKLIFCTKSGSISYISPTYAGSCSDRFITEDTNVAAKFTPGFMAMFDKGFNPNIIKVKKLLANVSLFTIQHLQSNLNESLISCFPFFLFICSFKLCNHFCNIKPLFCKYIYHTL